jgi:hypothetical protein
MKFHDAAPVVFTVAMAVIGIIGTAAILWLTFTQLQ